MKKARRMSEIWKEITDFPSYEVSDLGHVRNKNTQHMKTTWHDNDGYLKVTLMKFDNGKKSYRKTVHRLVAEAFMGGKHDTLQVNHINGIKDDNRVTNLEWVTGSENVKHAYDTGLRRPSGGRGEIRKVRVVESGGVYDNLHECAKAIGSDSGNISKCLHGKADTVKGYHLEYADTDTIAKPFLFEHQKEAVKRMFDGCILNGGVGSGKSRTSLFYYFKEYGGWIDENGYTPMKNPKDLFIITTAMKRDKLEWNLELSPFLLSTNPDENHYNNKVIIDSWNNIQKYAEVKDAFFIFDEDRVTGDGVWVKTFLKIAKSNRWIILSATPGDTWKDYIPVFIANGFYKNKTEFAREHIVWNPRVKFPKVDRYLNTGRLIRLRNRILVDMDFDRPTTAHHEDIYVKYNASMYRDAGKLRWDPYKDEPIQNAAGLCYVWRKIVNSDESRQVALLELFEDHPRMIVFYNFDYERDILMTICNESGIHVTEWSGHAHQPVPEGESWIYLVQYTAGCEGWNSIKTDTIVFYSQNYSYKVMQQAAGRIDRLNTPYSDLWYFHLKSRSGIDLAISKALSEKKQFNENKYVKW